MNIGRVVSCLLLVSPVYAQNGDVIDKVKSTDFGLIPRFETGVMLYQFEQKQDARVEFSLSDGGASRFAGNAGFKLQSAMPLVGGGLTFAAGRFYLDFVALAAFNGEDQDSLDTLAFTSEGRQLESTAVDAEWDHQNYAVSAGILATENIAFFVGYRNADTEFEFEATAPDRSSVAFSETDFNQSGPFFGGILRTDINSRWLTGNIAVSAAIAFLDAELDTKGERRVFADGTVTVSPNENFLSFLQPDGSVDGDSVGVKIGLTWNGDVPNVSGLRYQVKADAYRYDYSTTSSDIGFDFQEAAAKFTVGVSYAF